MSGTAAEREADRKRAIRLREMRDRAAWEKANRPDVGVSQRYVLDVEWLLCELERQTATNPEEGR